jgi:hypothetical protein
MLDGDEWIRRVATADFHMLLSGSFVNRQGWSWIRARTRQWRRAWRSCGAVHQQQAQARRVAELARSHLRPRHPLGLHRISTLAVTSLSSLRPFRCTWHNTTMVSDTVYEICLPVLQDPALSEDDKVDRVEDVLRQEARLTGKALEDAVLGVLWRHRDAVQGSISPPPLRPSAIRRPSPATALRRPSPAPWQQPSLSATNSPRSQSATIHPPPGFGPTPPHFARAKSSTASPFSSPRPSPRLAFATPQIPHSPSLSAYQFSEPTRSTEQYGDYGSDNVDWLVNDDASSNASFGDSNFGSYPSDWIQPSMVEMSTYDMLRSVLRDDKSDEELEHVLQLNGYDFSQTIMALADPQALSATEAQSRTYLVGKSMSPTSRPLTPSTLSKSGIVCKYWLSSGHCARADCRFSHDLSNHLCKYVDRVLSCAS